MTGQQIKRKNKILAYNLSMVAMFMLKFCHVLKVIIFACTNVVMD